MSCETKYTVSLDAETVKEIKGDYWGGHAPDCLNESPIWNERLRELMIAGVALNDMVIEAEAFWRLSKDTLNEFEGFSTLYDYLASSLEDVKHAIWGELWDSAEWDDECGAGEWTHKLVERYLSGEDMRYYDTHYSQTLEAESRFFLLCHEFLEILWDYGKNDEDWDEDEDEDAESETDAEADEL